MIANRLDAFDTAAQWLLTFLDDGGKVGRDASGNNCLYWPCFPQMQHEEWLATTFTDEVRAIVHAVIGTGSVAHEARAIVRDKVRTIISGTHAAEALRDIH